MGFPLNPSLSLGCSHGGALGQITQGTDSDGVLVQKVCWGALLKPTPLKDLRKA